MVAYITKRSEPDAFVATDEGGTEVFRSARLASLVLWLTEHDYIPTVRLGGPALP